MGRTASVEFWYGVRLPAWEEGELVEKLFEEENRHKQASPWEWQEDGVHLSLMQHESGDVYGFGSYVLYHDWDYEPRPWAEVEAAVTKGLAKVKNAVDAVLDRYSVELERDIYMQTQFS